MENKLLFNCRGKMVARVMRMRHNKKYVWRVYRPGYNHPIRKGRQKRFSSWLEAVQVAIDWSTRIQSGDSRAKH